MTTGIVICKDCGQPMQLDYQEMRRGAPLAIVTCKNRDCDLWSVTMSVDVYASLTDEQLTAYRKSVAHLKSVFNKIGAK